MRRRIQMIFQDPYASLNPRWKVADIVGEPLTEHGMAGSPAELRERVGALLSYVGLSAQDMDKYPHQFSGGQRQRIAIARALATQPAVMVADEPVTALDAFSAAQIVQLLTTLVRELQMGLLFISHDLSLVRAIATRTAVMYNGEIVEEGPSDLLWQNPVHEYTRSLIAAIPQITDKNRTAQTVTDGAG